MLDQVLPAPVVAELRASPLGDFVDALAQGLAERGHARSTIQDYLRAVRHLAHWMKEEGRSPETLAPDSIEEFIEVHLRACRCPVPSGRPVARLRAGVTHLMSILQAAGVVPRSAPPASPHDQLLAAYRRYLTSVRGAAPKTCDLYVAHALALMDATFGAATSDIGQLCSDDLARFVIAQTKRLAPGGGQRVASALRSFVRFLHVEGYCAADLIAAIPSPSGRLGSRPPTVLAEHEVEALMNAFDRASDIGLRDHAMTVCMLELGLRSCEVAAISLDDINWRTGVLLIPRGKSRREQVLPVPAPVGSAIAEYLRSARPTSAGRSLFVTHKLPKGVPLSPSAVRAAVRRAFDRAGCPPAGTHILRRTAATRMLRAGVGIKAVADVLRHQTIDTVQRYVRTDTIELAVVAMPWPGVRS